MLDVMENKPLQTAPTYSLEYQLCRFGENELYYPFKDSPLLRVFLLRNSGSNYLDKQFCWQIPSAAMDGIIIIQEAKPLDKPEISVSSLLSVDYKRYVDIRKKMPIQKRQANK